MPTHRLSDNEIAMLICPTAVRWPSPDSDLGRAVALTRMRAAVTALRDLAAGLDAQVAGAEDDSELSPDGVRKRRAALGLRALGELGSYKPLVDAERALTSAVEFFDGKIGAGFRPADTVAEASDGVELRAFIRSQTSPIDFCVKHLDDQKVVAAVLGGALPALSGLGDAEFAHVKSQALRRRHPREVEAREQLVKAFADLTEGVAATRRLVQRRCDIAQRSDGTYYAAHDATSPPQVKLSGSAAPRVEVPGQ